jgi:predicted Zn finger-like uncharacterized protein
MTITCPSCNRKYRLQDSLVTSPYQKMRCSRCGHVFVHGEKNGEEKIVPPVQKPLLSPPGIVEMAAGRRSSRRGVRILLFAILIAVILAAVGYYYWMNYAGASDSRIKIQKMEGQETLIRDGKAFFIKGIVANRSTKPRKFVILKARLYDEQGGFIGERFILAGLELSKDDVARMAKADIEARIAEFRKSNVNSFVLSPDGEAPFSVIFSDPYSGKPKKFSVEIIEAPRP